MAMPPPPEVNMTSSASTGQQTAGSYMFNPLPSAAKMGTDWVVPGLAIAAALVGIVLLSKK